MSDDWDLYAVVRGCRSAASYAANSGSNTPTASTTSSSQHVPLPFTKEENDVFSFPNLIQPRTNGFQELHQLFIPFIPTTTPTTPTTSGCGIFPNSSFADFAGAGSSNNNNTALPSASSYASNIRPHFTPQASSTSGFERFHNQHVQQLQQQQQEQYQKQQKQIQNQLQLVQQPRFQKPGQISSSNNNSGMTLTNTQAAQTPRSRKRKCQQKRMVCRVTAENLTADMWAWRKYGQKPIKGSPYPRNYYRCSTLKGCVARKQVERSNTEQDMFIVTYTGDHSHPRPTHRNSLAGSTRNKTSTTRQPASNESGSPGNTANPASSSSPPSATTPLIAAAANDECADEPMLSNEATSTLPEDEELDMASDDDILIPNMAAMMDNFFLGAEEVDGGSSLSGGGGNSTGDNPAYGSGPNILPWLTPAP